MSDNVSSPAPSASPSFKDSLTLPSALIGLAVGLSLYGIRRYLMATDGFHRPNAFIIALCIFILSFGAALLLNWKKHPDRAAVFRFSSASLLLALLFGATTFWIFGTTENAWKNSSVVDIWFSAIVFIGFVLIAFIQCWTESGRLRFPYVDLARHAWSNAFFALTGGILTGAFWLLLLLWSLLFSMLKIDFFATLFQSMSFILIVTPPVFAIGVAIGREKERIIGTMLGLAMMLCRFLLPLAALLTIAFMATLGVKGLSLLWETGTATPLLLSMFVTMIFLVNAATRAIPDTPLLPRPLRYLVAIALLLLPVYIGLAAYATSLRIEQYGLMPDRLWAIVLIGVAALYSIGYGASVFLSGKEWLSGVRYVNPPLALLSVALLWFFCLPFMSFERISAEQQISRLLNGDVAVDDFDFSSLRYRLGKSGEQALQTLAERAKAENHPDADAIIAQATAPAATSYREEEMRKRERIAADPFRNVIILPDGTKIAPETMLALRNSRNYTDECSKNSPCIVVVAKADTAQPERPLYFWFGSDDGWRGTILSVDNTKARPVGQAAFHPTTTATPRSLKETFKNGFTLSTPRYLDLQSERGALKISPEN